MGCITRFLVFIKDDLTIPVHKAGPVHPHVTLAASRTPVLIYKYRSLICLYHMIIIQKFMQIIIHGSQIFFPKTDHPVRHVLSGNGKPVPFEFFFKTVERYRIYILTIYDCRSKGRGYKASMKQISGMGCLYHVFIQFTGINADMMFLYHDTGRNELITSGNGIRKLFPSVFTKLSRQFFLFQIVINTFYCQPCYISRFFPWLFFLFGCFQFQVIRFRCIQVADCLCFIKEYDSPVYFHETYLFRIRHFFAGSAKTVLLEKDHLFHHQLHPVI